MTTHPTVKTFEQAEALFQTDARRIRNGRIKLEYMTYLHRVTVERTPSGGRVSLSRFHACNCGGTDEGMGFSRSYGCEGRGRHGYGDLWSVTVPGEFVGREVYVVQFHDTGIVTYLPDGRMVMDHGGFYSMIGSQRLDTYTPIVIVKTGRDGAWRIAPSGFRYPETKAEMETLAPFEPRTVVNPAAVQGPEQIRHPLSLSKVEPGHYRRTLRDRETDHEMIVGVRRAGEHWTTYREMLTSGEDRRNRDTTSPDHPILLDDHATLKDAKLSLWDVRAAHGLR